MGKVLRYKFSKFVRSVKLYQVNSVLSGHLYYAVSMVTALRTRQSCVNRTLEPSPRAG